MANELRGASPAGPLYARIINKAGQWWNGSAFEAYSSADWASYRIPLTEQGSSSVYVADFPSGIVTSGTYEYYVHRQVGGSPAETDPVVNTGKVDWTGSVSISVAAGAMTGADFYAYMLRRGFTRTDKSQQAFEAITDAVQEMRRRFGFDEAEVDAATTVSISALGTYKIPIESDMGLLVGLLLQDLNAGRPLILVSKKEFDDLYPWIANDPTFTGYPRHCCVFAGQIYIGPIPDRTSYVYRISYSQRGGTIVSSTTGVPFTNLYRDVLSDLTHAFLYEGLDERDTAEWYRQKFENGFALAVRRERVNSGVHSFQMKQTDV